MSTKENLPRHNLLYKSLGLVHNEATSMTLPRDNIFKALRFSLFQHGVKPLREGNHDSSSGSSALRRVNVIFLVDPWGINGVVVVVGVVVLDVGSRAFA